MRALSCCTLFWLVYFACRFAETVSQLMITISVPDGSNRNMIELTCDTSNVDKPSGCMFNFCMNGTDTLIPSNSNKLSFYVVPENESVITCQCQVEGISVTSPSLKVAAIPSSLTVPPMNVFRDENQKVTLQCPLVLGNLHQELNPYKIVWEEQDGQVYKSIFSRQFSLSNFNRDLIITKSGITPTTFKCALSLKRCDPGCPEDTFGESYLLLNLIEPISIHHSSTEQSIDFNEMATFHCNATGTTISISWDCSGSIDCSKIAMIVRSPDIENDITTVTSSLELAGKMYDEPVTVNITCTVRQQLVNVPEGSPADRNKTETFTLHVTNVTEKSTQESLTTVTANGKFYALISIPIVLFSLALAMVLILVKCYRGGNCKRSNASYPVESSTSAPLSLVSRKKTPIYEELPCTVYHADHPLLLRQYGVESDPNLSKVENISCHSEEPLCSDVSGLSGVSGNVPGAHKMPMYSTEGSVLDSLFPPQPWARSHSTFNSTHTQSTILGSNSHCDYQRHPHSYTHSEICISGSPDHFVGRPRSASHGAIRSNSEKPYPEELSYPIDSGSHSYPDHPPPFSNSPLRNSPSVSHASSNSSVQMQALSYASTRRSSSTEHPSPKKYISNEELISVVNSLKHNRNCEIPGCLCQEFRERYYEIEALASSNKHKSYERQVTNSNTVVTSSSTESDSDTDNNGRRAKMRLELGKGSNVQMYPHYHLSSKSYIRKTVDCESWQSRRRSRSVSDLTPITEIHEIATPKVGGPIVPGTPICPPNTLGIDGNSSVAYEAPTKQELLSSNTRSFLEKPRPPLLRQKSISMDNIPVLCLNDCLAKLVTPSPSKSYSLSLTTVLHNNNPAEPVLNTVHETSNSLESDDSNTSSRSESPPEPEAVKSSVSSQSDSEEATQVSLTSCRNPLKTRTAIRRVGESSGYESMEGENGSAVSVLTDVISKRRDSDLKSRARSQMSPVHISRSSSPFETETMVSRDGGTTLTTEC